MLTTLSTLKSRLGLTEFDVKDDAILTNALNAVSARFDKESNRTLARTIDATHEFAADETEIPVPCYPIETVTRFELKSTETEGWLEQPATPYLVRRSCFTMVRIARRLRRICRKRRSADIPVRSNVERQEAMRKCESHRAFRRCCGQECPRSASVAALPQLRHLAALAPRHRRPASPPHLHRRLGPPGSHPTSRPDPAPSRRDSQLHKTSRTESSSGLPNFCGLRGEPR